MSRRHAAGLLIGIAILGAVACASAPQELDLPPVSLHEAPTSTAEEEKALASPPRANEAGRTAAAAPVEVDESAGASVAADGAELRGHAATERDVTSDAENGEMIVIQAAEAREVTPRTLVEASALERRRRARADEPVAVITNQNLAEQAAGGQLTVLSPAGDAAGAAPSTAIAAAPATQQNGGADAARAGAAGAGAAVRSEAAAGTGAPAEQGSGVPAEEYWRSQALKIRLDWKEAVDTVDRLEEEVEELRRRFYAEDDPFYRDNQIKPAWDRALDNLAAARQEAEEHERRLTRFLEEGRRSGALPGWLREGIEYEPPATTPDTPAERRRSEDPWEPKVLHEDARDP